MSTAERSDGESPRKSENVFERIEENYRYLNKMMVEEIDIASAHGGITGSYREEMWMRFFRSIIPLKYSLAQGVIIIDSEKSRSREVDIAVYDEQYTPYVFQYNTLKFIPIEAVAVAIECKSEKLNKKNLKAWAKSITDLKSCASGIARMATGYSVGITNLTQKKTRPILILASNFQREKEAAIEENVKLIEDKFDFILLKKSEARSKGQQREFKLIVKNEDKRLGWWGSRLNGAEETGDLDIDSTGRNKEAIEKARQSGTYSELKICDDFKHLQNTLEDLHIPGNALLTLNFQLNQLLMLLNNPMLFPHLAYAKAFREIAELNIKVKP